MQNAIKIYNVFGILIISGKLCGDVDTDGISSLASVATPVPGGVGSVTTSVLAKHLLQAAKENR